MAWYNASWTKRIKVTVDNAKVGGADQTDFPVYVNLDDLPDAFFASCKSDGTDIVVTTTDGETKCYRELVAIDTTAKTGELYFNGDLDTDADTDFYIYYGNSAGAETNDVETWSNGFVSVYHMKDGADSSHINDSTGNNTLTKSGAGTPSEANGKIGKGQDSDGTSYSSKTSATGLVGGAGDRSLEIWSYPHDVTTDWRALFSYGRHSATNSAFDLIIKEGTAPNHIGFWTAGVDPQSNVTASVNTWYHICASYDGTAQTMQWIIDGADQGTNTGVVLATDITTNQTLFVNQQSHDYGNLGPLDGIADEIRFANVKRANSWFVTSYNNQSSTATFYQVGTEESSGGGEVVGQFLSLKRYW